MAARSAKPVRCCMKYPVAGYVPRPTTGECVRRFRSQCAANVTIPPPLCGAMGDEVPERQRSGAASGGRYFSLITTEWSAGLRVLKDHFPPYAAFNSFSNSSRLATDLPFFSSLYFADHFTSAFVK